MKFRISWSILLTLDTSSDFKIPAVCTNKYARGQIYKPSQIIKKVKHIHYKVISDKVLSLLSLLYFTKGFELLIVVGEQELSCVVTKARTQNLKLLQKFANHKLHIDKKNQA